MDLATYTSGLPRMPSNFAPKDWANPYIDYAPERLYDYLSNHKLAHRPGQHYEYANLGFGLLGHILELRAGKSYEELVVSRICAPLGMDDTRITLSDSMRQRLARGHNAALAPVANWDFLRARRRRRVAFDGERPVEVSPAMHESRRWSGCRRAEDDAFRASSEGERARRVARLVRCVAVRRRTDMEERRHRRLCDLHRLLDQNPAKLHPALQCGRL